MRTSALWALGIIMGNCAFVSATPTPYTADFSVLNTSQTDFATFKQIGSTGSSDPLSIHTKYIWNNGANPSVVLTSRYGTGNSAELVLQVAGNNSDGVFGDAVTSIEFKPYFEAGGSIANVRFGMSTRQNVTSARSNTYPDYRVDYDGTNLVLSEQAGWGTTRQRTLAMHAVSIATGNSYRLELGAQGTSSTSDLTISARLYQVSDPIPLVAFDAVDHPKVANDPEGGWTNPPQNDRSADWADSGADLYLTGQTGVYGGMYTGSAFGGIEITSFTVTVPEPAMIGIAAVPALGAFMRRRRQLCKR